MGVLEGNLAVQRYLAQHYIFFSEVHVKSLPKDCQLCSLGGSCYQCSPQLISFSPNTFRQYLKQESIDKKRKEFDTNGWQLFSKKSQVHFILRRKESQHKSIWEGKYFTA